MAYKPPTKRKGWANKIKYTNDIKNIKLKILLKGGPGVGKTRLLGTAPNAFIVATEGGLLTLLDKHVPNYEFDSSDKGYVFDTVMALLDDIEQENEVFDDEGNLMVDFSKVESIGLDSIAKLSELLKMDIDAKAGDSNNTQALWGDLRMQMIMIMNRFYQLPKHLICTVGEAEKHDETTGKKYYTLNMQGSYKDMIEHEFDFVFWMQKEASRTGETTYYTTGSNMNGRSGKMRGIELSKKIENPTFDLIWGEIEKQLTERVDTNE